MRHYRMFTSHTESPELGGTLKILRCASSRCNSWQKQQHRHWWSLLCTRQGLEENNQMSFFSFFTQQRPWKGPEEVMSQLGLCILTIFFLCVFKCESIVAPFKLQRWSNWVRWGETFSTCINPKWMLNAARGVNKPAEWGEYLWKYTTRQLDYIRGEKEAQYS